jgi:hypothetical protein
MNANVLFLILILLSKNVLHLLQITSELYDNSNLLLDNNLLSDINFLEFGKKNIMLK